MTKRTNFQAKISYIKDSYYLKVTYNGYRWHSLDLNPGEMEIVRELLSQQLAKIVKELTDENRK